MTGQEILVGLRGRFPLLDDLPPSTWVVGGAVRDLLVGEAPRDLDLATADAEALAGLLARRSGRRPIRLGRHELTALRIVDGAAIYDLTPLFGGSIESDLHRRDFSINAIAVDCATGRLLDPFDGLGALEERRLTLVRESNLDDDPLRVIKAVRMAVRYRLSVDEATAMALRRRSAGVAQVAVERVHDELMAILSEPDLPRGIELLRLLDLDQVLFRRRLDPAPFGLVAGAPLQSSVALALGHRDTSGAALHAEARRWCWSVAEERRVSALAAGARCVVAGDEPVIVLHDLGPELAASLAPLLRGLGQPLSADLVDATMKAQGARIFATQPLLTGDEMVKLTGLPPGPAIGRLKRALLEAQVRGEISTRPDAETLVKSLRG
jgi:hypothetical protein